MAKKITASRVKMASPRQDIISREVSCLAGWRPSAISKHDNFTTLYYVKDVEEFDPCCANYIISIRVIAMDDELIKAVAIEGILAEIQYAFFSGFDRATEDDYWTSRLRYATAKK